MKKIMPREAGVTFVGKDAKAHQDRYNDMLKKTQPKDAKANKKANSNAD